MRAGAPLWVDGRSISYSLFDWQPEQLVGSLRRTIPRAFVRWNKLTPEAADIMASWVDREPPPRSPRRRAA